jgi:hypothetical protein
VLGSTSRPNECLPSAIPSYEKGRRGSSWASQNPSTTIALSPWRSLPIRLHSTDGDDFLLEHPAPNVEAGDVVMLADGREALVTSRVDTNGDSPFVALLRS